MKNRLFLLLFLLGLAPLGAQKLDLKRLEGLKIRSIGPAGMSGRVTAIDVLLNDPEVIYVGTASGGMWRSRSGGVTWEPIFDEAPVASIGAIAVNQKNPDEIWVGTGEGNPRNTQNSGLGLYKTIDGGKTWTCVGLENTRVIHRILLHRDDPNTLFVAALGSAWGPNPDRGVFKSTDGGKSWRKVLFVNDSTGCADLVVDPRNPNKLIAAMWEYGRKPWTFHSGGPGSGIFVSFDGGESWKKRTAEDGPPKGDLVRTAKEGFDRLQEAGKTIKRVNEAMALAPYSLKKDLGKLTKDLKKKIAELEKLYMMPPTPRAFSAPPTC